MKLFLAAMLAFGAPAVAPDAGPTASYIVVLNGQSRPAVANVGHVFTHALNGFEATLTQRELSRLEADPSVKYVAPNETISVEPLGTQPNPPSWGLDRIDQRNLPLDNSYTFPNTAPNVHAYILSTGIRTTHVDFGGRAIHGRDTVDNDNDATDCHGHGTQVAGVVGGAAHGVAKGVTLVAIRMLNCQGSATTAQVIAGVDWVTANAIKPAVAVLVAGGPTNTAYNDAVRASIASGVTYAAVAGSSSSDACNFSPGGVTEAIVSGATDATDTRTGFTNIGPCLDLFAPGASITTTTATSDTATVTVSGTSFATAHTGGVAALIASANPAFTPQQVRDRMVADATPGVVINPGTGSPNLLLFVDNSGTPPPPCTGTNPADLRIPDYPGPAVSSAITISGCTGNASSTSSAEVHIIHPNRGDIVIDLVAPDGSTYRLQNRSNDTGDNIHRTYVVNLSSEARNGTWRLRIRDRRPTNTGFLDSWTLRL